jgi:uncharacterized repeat protein (TIGR01451 family)
MELDRAIQILDTDDQKNLIGQTYSLANNYYHFFADSGNYHVQIDTTLLPFNIVCPAKGDTLVAKGNSSIESVNFYLACKDGLDLGVRSVVTKGIVFPGQKHSLQIHAGDLARWYGQTCSKGKSAQLQLTITGPVGFVAASQGALVPTKNGNVYTYDIADVATLNFDNEFSLDFLTDTTAQSGDSIVVYASITSNNGDYNLSNNHFKYSYVVVNSHDPNLKEVSPEYFKPGYEGYFTYTIHFQNTGNAPAFNIRLLDTLDASLDVTTFEVLGFSHPNRVALNKNILNVYYKNIMLIDSTTNEKASHGFIQYRIKPKNPVLETDRIKNTAHIYFDFNEAIVTNTTVTKPNKSMGINETSMPVAFSVFPNPTTGTVKILNHTQSSKETLIRLIDLQGKIMYSTTTNLGASHTIDLSDMEPGMYILEVSNATNIQTTRLIKQ